MKFSHVYYDVGGYNVGLKFLRDIEGREIDFLITLDDQPWFTVEVKLSGTTVSKHLKYFKNKLKIPFSFQVVNKPGVDFEKDDVRVISADKFLTGLL